MSKLRTPDTAPLWEGIEAVIKEAEDRYGLILVGRVVERPGQLVAELEGRYGGFSIPFSHQLILDVQSGIPECLMEAAADILREMAEKRDREAAGEDAAEKETE